MKVLVLFLIFIFTALPPIVSAQEGGEYESSPYPSESFGSEGGTEASYGDESDYPPESGPVSYPYEEELPPPNTTPVPYDDEGTSMEMDPPVQEDFYPVD